MTSAQTSGESFDLLDTAGRDVPPDEVEFAMSRYTLVLWRSKWQQYNPNQVLSWELRRLNPMERPAIPQVPGVYSLLVQPGIANHPGVSFLMYIGKTNSLYRRFGEYLNKERLTTGRPKIYRALRRYSDYLWFCFAPLPTADDAALTIVEDALLMAYVPPWNDDLPAEIRDIVEAF